MNHISEAGKHTVDGLSVVVALGTLAQYLPAIAALFTVIWTSIRIWETRTVQGLLGRTKRDRD